MFFRPVAPSLYAPHGDELGDDVLDAVELAGEEGDDVEIVILDEDGAGANLTACGLPLAFFG